MSKDYFNGQCKGIVQMILRIQMEVSASASGFKAASLACNVATGVLPGPTPARRGCSHEIQRNIWAAGPPVPEAV
ncbi:hypothetical protein TWF506_005178 [Arthrobotrys conoides]|uniref:Uncharacterized protein n=1 Tax=Arthrobotrys conoides TaxID=74498 RepID=A0AAN8NT35_9PEZI